MDGEGWHNRGGLEQVEPDRRGFALALDMLMSAISEEWWCAGWMLDIEYDLWALVCGDKQEGRMYKALYESGEMEALTALSEKCNGWWTADGFVELPVWREMYANRR